MFASRKFSTTFDSTNSSTMNRKHIEAQYLTKGDKLASGGVVTSNPSRGIKTLPERWS